MREKAIFDFAAALASLPFQTSSSTRYWTFCSGTWSDSRGRKRLQSLHVTSGLNRAFTHSAPRLPEYCSLTRWECKSS
jgi:hypothetical protein